MAVVFGKFHGRTLGEIEDLEPSYVRWLARTITRDPDLLDAARVVAAAPRLPSPAPAGVVGRAGDAGTRRHAGSSWRCAGGEGRSRRSAR